MAEGDSYKLFARCQAGENEAATEIFDRYSQRLVALARSRLSARMGRRIDPEDVVQSAFRSFFVHARGDAYAFRQSGDLWRLLVQITLHKLYGQAERHHAKRRSVAREEVAGEQYADISAPEPTPVEVVALVEQVHLVFGQLSPDQQLVLTERLNGLEIDQIAASVQKSPRTVRRMLAEAEQQIERQLTGDGVSDRADRSSQLKAKLDRRVALRADSYVLERLLGAGGMGMSIEPEIAKVA